MTITNGINRVLHWWHHIWLWYCKKWQKVQRENPILSALRIHNTKVEAIILFSIPVLSAQTLTTGPDQKIRLLTHLSLWPNHCPASWGTSSFKFYFHPCIWIFNVFKLSACLLCLLSVTPVAQHGSTSRNHETARINTQSTTKCEESQTTHAWDKQMQC